MFKNLINNWKTTSAGLTMIIGSTIHLVFAIKGGTADENTWTIAVTAILGGLAFLFAGDASATDKQIAPIAAAVDKINQQGSDPDTALLVKPPANNPPIQSSTNPPPA